MISPIGFVLAAIFNIILPLSLSALCKNYTMQRLSWRVLLITVIFIYIYFILRLTVIGRATTNRPPIFGLIATYRDCIMIDTAGVHVLKPGYLIQILLNYLLYAPLGTLVACYLRITIRDYNFMRGIPIVVVIGLLVSLSIELLQMILHVGIFETDDFLATH